MDGWTQKHSSLWHADGEVRVFPAVWMPVRSTAVRLDSGDIWVHAPIDFEPQAVRSLQGLGEVKYLTAPSGFHHLYLERAQQHFPNAEIWAPPLVDVKQPTLQGARHLSASAPPPWSDEIETLAIEGMPKVQEWVFFHRASQSLIVTDLVFNLKETRGWMTPIFLTLFGTRGRFAQSRLFKSFIRHPEAYDASLSKLLQWPFQRVIMAHGEVVEGGDMRDAMARVLGKL